MKALGISSIIQIMEYHKINSIYKRDITQRNNPFIVGEWAEPEFEYLRDNLWEFTEKVDGTNIRVMFDGKNVTFGGKTDNAQIPSHLVDKLNKLFYAIEGRKKLQEIFTSKDEPLEVCLYGEGFGYKIQGKVGIDYLRVDVDFYLFDIRIGRWWLQREDVYDIAEKLGLKHCRALKYGTLSEAIEMVKEGFSSDFGDAKGEGLVLRPKIELLTRSGERIITKVKCRDFIV